MTRPPGDLKVFAHRYGLLPIAVWTVIVSVITALEINHMHHDTADLLAGYGATWVIVSFGIALFSARRYKQELQLVESEWKFRTLSESATDWEYWVTEEGVIAYMSPSVTDITGYTPEDFAKDKDLRRKLIHPDDVEAYRMHQRNFKSPEHEEMNVRILTRDGRIKWLSHVCGPLYKDGIFRGRRVNNRDITRLVAVENQKNDLQSMLRHDIRNPLTIIQGNIELVMERYAATMDQESLQMLKNAVGKVTVVKSLLDDMTVISKIESAVFDMEKRPVDFNELILETCFTAKDQTARAGLQFVKDIEEGLPPVSVNRDYVLRSVHNLINNAVKFTPPGGRVELSAGIAQDGPESCVFVKVSDSGIGVPAKDLKRIFEKHYRSSSALHVKGSGLGLALVKLVMDCHGGSVEVESEEGRGSTFTLFFPVREKDAETKLRPSA